MPTPSEQKALAFVAIVVLLGGAVRAVRAGSTPLPTPLEQQALARQATSAESAASSSAGRAKKARGVRLARPKRGAGPSVVGGVVGVPMGAPSGSPPSELGRNGFPPPGPRIDVDNRHNPRELYSTVSGAGEPRDNPPAPQRPVDLDRADEREIDVLPRVGPALARRIVANRDSFGAFGSLEGLGRVRGIGAATLKRLSPLVTFSGRPSSRP